MAHRPNVFTQALQAILPELEGLIAQAVGSVPEDQILAGLVQAADVRLDQLAELLPPFWKLLVQAADGPALRIVVDLAVKPLIDKALAAAAQQKVTG